MPQQLRLKCCYTICLALCLLCPRTHTRTHPNTHIVDHTQPLTVRNKATGGKFVNYFGQIETRIVQADSANCC